MGWNYTFEMRDGKGKVHTLKGVVPFEGGPPDEAFRYAMSTAVQDLMAQGPRCPGPFRILNISMERTE